MQRMNLGLIERDSLSNLSNEELIDALKISRLETFKYVNKFLEVEEKWAFTNILLKKLNSIRQKGDLCQTISEGFLKLTNSKICAFCLFNQDTNAIEFIKIAYAEHKRRENISKLLEKINNNCNEFLESQTSIDSIIEYFDLLSGNEFIVIPIIHSTSFFGYMLLKNEDCNFYNQNINFINIFPEHIALILENISLYQESEKQNKRKVEFLAGISHEFKTPLNAIIGFAEIIQTGFKNFDLINDNNNKIFSRHIEYIKYVNNIVNSSQHLLSLIQDVIDVSKSQYRPLELNYSKFSSREEVEQIIHTLEKMVDDKKIDLNYTLCNIAINADKKRFRQLIYNLVSNAIKFNKQKGKISILTYIKENKFFFEITDTGDGISKRNHEKIFDFFSQVNRSQLKRQLGSGVGLALCKKITDAHKGKISFKSQIKKGSCFWFYLPLEKQEDL